LKLLYIYCILFSCDKAGLGGIVITTRDSSSFKQCDIVYVSAGGLYHCKQTVQTLLNWKESTCT